MITAPVKIKGRGGRELQLPAMQALTSKASSQAFFLRILKVIIQLTESTQLLGQNKGRGINKTNLCSSLKKKKNQILQSIYVDVPSSSRYCNFLWNNSHCIICFLIFKKRGCRKVAQFLLKILLN